MLIQNGKILAGNPVSEHKFQGVTTLNQIEDYGLQRPTLIESAKVGSEHYAAKEAHGHTNRVFLKPRVTRAEIYSGYIEAVEVHGKLGGTPAITVYSPERLENTENGVMVDYSTVLTAIDGETQTEARYMLRDRNPETGTNPIAITVYHGIPESAARQILHDYNHYAKPVSERETAAFNTNGELSIAVDAVIKKSGISREHINQRGGLSTKKTKLSKVQLLTGIAGYQLNGRGSMSAVSARQLSELNSMGARPVDAAGVDAMEYIARQCFHEPVIGKCPAVIWQVAGVLVSKNRDVTQLDWKAGYDAYIRTKSAGRGGKRTPVKERLAAIEAAM